MWVGAWQPSLLSLAWLRWRFILPAPIGKVSHPRSPDAPSPGLRFHAIPCHSPPVPPLPCAAVHENSTLHRRSPASSSPSSLSVLLIHPARTMATSRLLSPAHSHPVSLPNYVCSTTRFWRNHNQTSESTPSFSLFLIEHAFSFFPSPG